MMLFRIRFFLSAAAILVALNTQGQEAPETFSNPVLPGFHPDPSICRVGEDYYLVNSTFEWFPGLPVYHSRDLVNWELIGYGIDRPLQVELPAGLEDSRGLYAPTIRFHRDTFYIINTCVQCGGNFYITATDPSGPWSDPVWLESPGIDPSLFWDDDGRCYYTGHGNISGVADWPAKNGVWMQELDTGAGRLVGKRVQLTHGHASNARWTEGPHLYRIGGKYLLLVAEGGTGFHHAITVHHSDSLWGPYIPNHANPVLTHRHLGLDFPIHSTGHADLVETRNGEWWSVMLAKRLVEGYTLLARETFLARVEFESQEGVPTPVFNRGEGKLLDEQPRPDLPWSPVEKAPVRDEFETEHLGLNWNFLRTPYKKWYTLKGGYLELEPRAEVIDSLVNPSLVARRITHHVFRAATALKFSPENENEHAGLVIYHKSTNHFQLVKNSRELILVRSLGGNREELARVPYRGEKVILRAEAEGLHLRFSYGATDNERTSIGPVLDMKVISDELSGGFNGPYVGMYATGNGSDGRARARFDWFEYDEQKEEKTRVWIYTDMSDRTIPGPNHMGTINDPDDISAMAGYLLMGNMFETLGIVVASTHRSQHQDTPDQAKWADGYLGQAYRRDVVNLNRTIGGYPENVRFMQSSIKETAERYLPERTYHSLEEYGTVRALLDTASSVNGVIHVLCWGSLTEPAILVNHCRATGQTGILDKLVFIAHWTNSSWHQGSREHPEDVANCREDAAACAYLKQMALEGYITYYECGAIGQHGIVSGSPKGDAYFDRFRTSNLGTIFVEGKFVHGHVDHSDAATYWTLLGNWGVGLEDIASNGTNCPEVEQRNSEIFTEWSPRIHDELLRRSLAASGESISGK